MVTVEFDSMGEAVRLALVAGEYAGGGLAVLLLDATDPRSDGYMAEWGVLTANVPAAEWCRGRGNIAIDADGSTVYGAFFGHQGETPGLGAEIEKPGFSEQFNGKELWKNDVFSPVAVVKKGQKPQDDRDYVDGISGGTITSKGVSAMLSDCLQPYADFLKKVKDNDVKNAGNNK